jgi:hypothetical protein
VQPGVKEPPVVSPQVEKVEEPTSIWALKEPLEFFFGSRSFAVIWWPKKAPIHGLKFGVQSIKFRI